MDGQLDVRTSELFTEMRQCGIEPTFAAIKTPAMLQPTSLKSKAQTLVLRVPDGSVSHDAYFLDGLAARIVGRFGGEDEIPFRAIQIVDQRGGTLYYSDINYIGYMV